VPDDLAIETFVAARKRGVKIEIIVPRDRSDSKSCGAPAAVEKMFAAIAGTLRWHL
jgi:hypothetical protein